MLDIFSLYIIGTKSHRIKKKLLQEVKSVKFYKKKLAPFFFLLVMTELSITKKLFRVYRSIRDIV